MKGRGNGKGSSTHNVKPDRDSENVENFNKNELEQELVKKEQNYKD